MNELINGHNKKKRLLITGVAGFIGFSVCRRLLADTEYEITGIDNLNDYYAVELKYDRLRELGIRGDDIRWNEFCRSLITPDFIFIRMNLEHQEGVRRLFSDGNFDIVIHLAAQSGVRYSVDNPQAFIESNINGFINVLEGCRCGRVSHLLYASSSSVYGLNGRVPFSEHDSSEHPVSLYAATKKSNELMAHAYSELYGIPTTGLRFFTVYGPWGRPDMSYFLYIDAILRGRPIKVFNNGDMIRDFTYIDDIVEGIVRMINIIPEPNLEWDAINPDPASSSAPYRVYNIGNQHPVRLMDYIGCIEKATGRKSEKDFMEKQPGDLYQTYADSSLLSEVLGFIPNTDIQTGINKTVDWFREYYNI